MGGLSLWRPFRELERWRREVESHFPRAFTPVQFEEAMEYFPAIESYVQNGQLIVRADLPGIDPKDVDVSVLGNVLTIKGERKTKREIKEQDYLSREVMYGDFERRLTLPEGAETEKIKANFKNGVLEITMPATKELGARKIPLQVETEK